MSETLLLLWAIGFIFGFIFRELLIWGGLDHEEIILKRCEEIKKKSSKEK